MDAECQPKLIYHKMYIPAYICICIYMHIYILYTHKKLLKTDREIIAMGEIKVNILILCKISGHIIVFILFILLK
jgi:hypothetical protein